MPRQTIEYRCLLISPGDVSAERDALTELVNRWNAQIGRGLNARVELVRWESHATPDMTLRGYVSSAIVSGYATGEIYPLFKGLQMLKLAGYMDETGHSKDERQRFVGVAGLFAPAENREVFERKWKQALADFKIPSFHMKDFASRRKHYEGWSELKRQRIMATSHPFPIGAIVSLDDYRSFSAEDREPMGNPYHYCLMGCVYMPA
jgi:hypothetical protein